MGILVVHLPVSLQKTNYCQEMFLKLYQDQGKREQEKGTVFTLTCLSSLVASTDIGTGFLTEYLKAAVGYR